jgi:hypothetical protein
VLVLLLQVAATSGAAQEPLGLGQIGWQSGCAPLRASPMQANAIISPVKKVTFHLYIDELKPLRNEYIPKSSPVVSFFSELKVRSTVAFSLLPAPKQPLPSQLPQRNFYEMPRVYVRRGRQLLCRPLWGFARLLLLLIWTLNAHVEAGAVVRAGALGKA